MESKTKRRLASHQIADLVASSFGDGVRVADIQEMDEGMFNAVYRLELGPRGDVVVMKSSPPSSVPLLTYERDLLRTEAAFYRLASELVDVPLPRVVASDFSRERLDGDVVFLSFLDGSGWQHLNGQMGAADHTRLMRDLGRMVARLHGVTSSDFGYFQPGAARGVSWREAFVRMVDDVLDDAERFRVDLPEAQQVRRLVRAHAGWLEAVKAPALVHFDLWPGNVLISERAGRPEISGIIDAERAMWADPVAEFVSIGFFPEAGDGTAFFAGYGDEVGQFPVRLDLKVRLAMYEAYLGLIMLVEEVPRGYDLAAHAAVHDFAQNNLVKALAFLDEQLPS